MDEHSLTLTQQKYLRDLLEKTHMSDSNPCSNPMCTSATLSKLDSDPFEHVSLYRSTVGSLQYLTMTRPDIAFTVNRLSQYLQAPTVKHWAACKRQLRYLAGTQRQGLRFTPAHTLALTAFSNADYASNLDDRRSTSGVCVYLGPNLIAWSAKKQEVVSRSSTEAE